jgi:hypothetical protein
MYALVFYSYFSQYNQTIHPLIKLQLVSVYNSAADGYQSMCLHCHMFIEFILVCVTK